MALWLLIAIALARNDISRAVELATGLLEEHRHPPPEERDLLFAKPRRGGLGLSRSDQNRRGNCIIYRYAK